jgi:Flp pilus assembly protein TadG
MKRFRSDSSGSAVVEFALVGPIFFGLLFSVLEIGWVMAKTMMLEMAMEQTVRELRIGRPQGYTHNDVKTLICNRSYVFRSSCTDNIIVELIPVAMGAALPADNARCIDRGVKTKPVVRFDPGKRSEMVFIRACATTALMTPGLGLGLQLDWNGDKGYYITTQTAFLNEPS